MGGGVTTVQVLPGSGNVMGGEGGIFKLKPYERTVGGMWCPDAPKTLKVKSIEIPQNLLRWHVGKIQRTSTVIKDLRQ